MKTSKSVSLDDLFGAIADPTRRAILDRLARGDARVTEIAADFPISLNSVSKHLRMLERAGLVRRTIKGREHLLALNSDPLDRASEWIDRHRRFWEDGLAALDKFATQKHPPAQKSAAPTKRKPRK
jgi:DNA-binding transcriptional ArsR family regulator